MIKFTKNMMSIVFVLMLGCSISGNTNPVSSHIDTHIDTLVSTIDSTNRLTQLQQDTVSIYESQEFAKVLKYVSQISKRSCTEKEEIAKAIYHVALENKVDIYFILAQGTIETHLGTTGIGKSRKSIFGVYRSYPSYTACINDYVRILKKSYLVRGRTEQDLMRRYVTGSGARYAGDRGYETRLLKTYKNIKRTMSDV